MSNGIYTIGSDYLSGLPAGTKTVMVDNDGNFKYFADVTTKIKKKNMEHIMKYLKCVTNG